MKILVFADSHSDVETMESIVTFEKPDTVIHLGDHFSDGETLQGIFTDIPFYLVRGNTDTEENIEEQIVTISGMTMFITHGHRYNVKLGLGKLAKKAASAGADTALFGHTHIPFLNVINGVWIMNPGRIGRISSRKIYASYGLVTTSDDKISYEIVKLKE